MSRSNLFHVSVLAMLVAFPLCSISKSASSQQVIHAVGALFDGGGVVLTVGETKYYTVPFGCTIRAWDMTAVPPGSSATIDVWKANGQYPTASNSITGSRTPSISGFTPIHSIDVTGWNTAIAQNDTFAFYLSAAGSATEASLVLQCQ